MPNNSVEQIRAIEVLDRFYNAFSDKNLEVAVACFAPDAVFWHSFDGLTDTLDRAARGWEKLFSAVDILKITDVRQEAVANGVVRRHFFIMSGQDGALKGKACSLFVKVRDGLITRIDEYIDLSRDLPVNGNNPMTPGLPDQDTIL